MIYFVEGDILKTKAAALVHGVAPNDDCKPEAGEPVDLERRGWRADREPVHSGTRA